MNDKIIKQDNKVMELLKVSEVNRVLCFTDKGTLTLKIRKGDKQYHLVLDSVPLDKHTNKELMELLFPIPVKEIPQVNKQPKEEVKTNEMIPLSKKKSRPSKIK